MVPSCLMFVLMVILVLFPLFMFLFSYVWIPESPPIWERSANSVYHLSHLFGDITSCCDFSPLANFGRSLGTDCISA